MTIISALDSLSRATILTGKFPFSWPAEKSFLRGFVSYKGRYSGPQGGLLLIKLQVLLHRVSQMAVIWIDRTILSCGILDIIQVGHVADGLRG